VTSKTDAASSSSDDEARYGIKRVTIHQFETGGYRYSNLADAIAQAKRSEPKAGAS
jgi:hypothetical protein